MATMREVEQNKRRTTVPPCSIHEEEGKVVLTIEMPGVDKNDVSISVANDELKIFGRREARKSEATYLLRERRVADFASSYTLDDTIDRERIEAESSRGVLTVTLHLKEANKPRQITVREVK